MAYGIVETNRCCHAMNDKPKHSKKLVALVSVVALLLVITLTFGAYSSSSVCKKCGIVKDSIDWQIPLSNITLFGTASEHETPVSVALVRNGVVTGHKHKWLCIHGGGNGVLCAIGEGRHISPAVESKEVASVLDASSRFGETKLREQLVRLMFDPKTSRMVLHLGHRFPESGFKNASDFHAWFEEKKEDFFYEIEVFQR